MADDRVCAKLYYSCLISHSPWMKSHGNNWGCEKTGWRRAAKDNLIRFDSFYSLQQPFQSEEQTFGWCRYEAIGFLVFFLPTTRFLLNLTDYRLCYGMYEYVQTSDQPITWQILNVVLNQILSGFLATLRILSLTDVLSDWVTAACLTLPVFLQSSATLAVSVWCVLVGGAWKHEWPAGCTTGRHVLSIDSLERLHSKSLPFPHTCHKRELCQTQKNIPAMFFGISFGIIQLRSIHF